MQKYAPLMDAQQNGGVCTSMEQHGQERNVAVKNVQI